MNTTVNALKNLYEAAGGEEATVENVNLIPDMIDALADIATPFIKSADEGKVVQNGALVVQTSKNITENGTHDTTANNQVVVNVAGNPNSVETITGTLANPWGSLDVGALYIELENNNVSITLNATIGENTASIPVAVNTSYNQFRASVTDDYDDGVISYIVSYSNMGVLQAFSRAITTADSGSIDNLMSLAAAVPTTLTIINHPLPTT